MASFEFDVDNVLSLMTEREKVAMLAGTKLLQHHQGDPLTQNDKQASTSGIQNPSHT
jgi:hypothetical protein